MDDKFKDQPIYIPLKLPIIVSTIVVLYIILMIVMGSIFQARGNHDGAMIVLRFGVGFGIPGVVAVLMSWLYYWANRKPSGPQDLGDQ